MIKVLKTRKTYGLVWEDKEEEVARLCRTKLPVLNLDSDRSITTDANSPTHVIIEGDNYHALSALNFTHAGKVDLIYIDPPYNTGNKDFIYNDNYVDAEDTYKHSKWLSFMEKRLRLAHDLLTEEGSLFASIDDNEYPRLVMLMELVFGEKNIKTIAVKMSEATGVKMSSVLASGRIPKLKEYVVIAKKDGIRNLHIDKLPKEEWDDEYKQVITNLSEDELQKIKSVKDNPERTEEETRSLDEILARMDYEPISQTFKNLGLSTKKDQLDFKYQNAWRIFRTASLEGGAKKLAIDKKRSFKTPPNFFLITTPRDKAYVIDGSVNPDTPSPRSKVLFADEYLTIHPGDFWSDIKTTGLENEGGVEFKNGKKPLKLIDRIIRTNQRNDIVILDFFAGSGTTGEAVLRLNKSDGGTRKAILATYNREPEGSQNIMDDACYPRVSNHILGINGRENLGGNLVFFSTDFVDQGKNDDQTRSNMLSRCEELICLREGTFEKNFESAGFRIFSNSQSRSAIIFDVDQIQDCVNQLNSSKTKTPVSFYVFSLSGDNYESEFLNVDVPFALRAIPETILAVYRRIFSPSIKSLGN
jgi:adenine-specific DNA-methyltransferase